jgi:hypothetical protein
MGILIPRQLTIEQYIKLFSNPVSGLVCEVDAYNRDHRVNYHTKNIRYSKSMMLKALDFWFDQLYDYYTKIWHMRKPFIDMSANVFELVKELGSRMELVRSCPDTFLFSHRYIQPGNFKDYTDDTPCALLKKKYPNIIKKDQPLWIQKGKRDIFFDIHLRDLGIHFTVFPNEHPYITRDKISKVGKTDRGNVFVLHGAQKKIKTGAQLHREMMDIHRKITGENR